MKAVSPISPAAAGTAALDGIAYAGMFTFGIVMTLVGAVMPVLSERLAIGLDRTGTIFLVMNASMLAASVLVGPVMDRVGMKAPLALGALGVGVALAVVAGAAGLPALFVGVALVGFSGGALNASTNTLVADLHDDPDRKAAALNLLGVFFGVGALLLPLGLGALVSRAGLGGVLGAAAALPIATAAAAALLRFPPPKQARGWPLADVGRFARQPLVAVLALLLFFQSGNEFLLGGYFTTFLTRDLGVSVEGASYRLAAFWGAIMAARLLLSRVVVRLGAGRLIVSGAVLAAAGAAIVAFSRTPLVASTGIVVTGFALAGIFPTVLGLAGAAFREHSGTVFGLLFTVALTGGMTLPWLAGHLAAAFDLRYVFMLAAANFLAIAALASVAGRIAPRKP